MKIRDTIIAWIIGFLMGLFWSLLLVDALFQKSAIENGHAHYNPENSKFEWNTNCYNNTK